MSISLTLARPLARRVVDLPEPMQNPTIMPVPEGVIDKAFEALDAGHTHYTDRPGILPLRSQIVNALNRHYRLELNADAATITCGATEARFVALKQLVASSSTVLHAGSGSVLQAAAHLIGINLATTPDLNVSLVYLTPHDVPAQVLALCAQAVLHGWWVLFDVSSGLTGDFHPAQRADLAPQVITVGSFSSTLPGWRVGWMAGSKAANKLRAYKQSMTICTTSISQWAVLGLEDV